jgi:quercetin dioxygenase-like cupin family protein
MSTQGIGTYRSPLVHPVTGERIVFRRRARDTAGELLEVTLYSAPTGFVPSAHVHPSQEERLEISGAPMAVRIGNDERLYQPGDVAVVPPGVPHVVWNPTDQEASATMQFRPALHTETMFETFFGLAQDGKVGKGGVRDILHMLVLARAYRREMQLPSPTQRFIAPLATVVSPIASLLGHRGRYDQYSGPDPG